MKELKVRLTFTEDLLGTASGDKDIHREFIASKAPDAITREEEVAAVGADAVIEKSMTVFPRNEDGNPIVYDYQVKGFFKDTCGGLARCKGAKKGELGFESTKLTAFKKVIDKNIFVEPRKIEINYDGEVGNLERPLRASTAQGERIALANSEKINAGASIEFTIVILNDANLDAVVEWLNYGRFSGLGQWRNASFGRFSWEWFDGKKWMSSDKLKVA